jgi:Fe2+ or Zn2+ uptake regulation protein
MKTTSKWRPTKTQAEYLEVLSDKLEDALTAKDVAILLEVSDVAAYTMLRILTNAGLAKRIGKGGPFRAYSYIKVKKSIPVKETVSVSDTMWDLNDPNSVTKFMEMLNDFKALINERNSLKEENKKLKTRLENVEKALLD